MLLGDDIVISNDIVAKEYKVILTEWGIEFNEVKLMILKMGSNLLSKFVFMIRMSHHFPYRLSLRDNPRLLLV
jgi:hypothetical protein